MSPVMGSRFEDTNTGRKQGQETNKFYKHKINATGPSFQVPKDLLALRVPKTCQIKVQMFSQLWRNTHFVPSTKTNNNALKGIGTSDSMGNCTFWVKRCQFTVYWSRPLFVPEKQMDFHT